MWTCDSCESRRTIITQGQWKTDAAVGASLLAMLVLIHGGSMSVKTRKMLTIAFIGAIGAVFIDGLVKPNLGR